MSSKLNILFILHYPPPLHGAAMVGYYIRESKVIQDNFNSEFINLGTSRTVVEIGKNGVFKWFRYFSIIFRTIFTLFRFKPDLVYLTLTVKGWGFYKDVLIVLIAKAFKKKLVYHFHNKGVSTRQNKAIDNYLYRIVFKNANVILLSKLLYQDIQKYVKKNNVYFCPNGTYDYAENQTIGNEPVECHILFLSNLIQAKGVFVLLEACEILKKKGLDFRCTFVGAESDVTAKKLLEKAEDYEILDCIEYIGSRSGFEKESLFLNSNIFVFPTFYDNEVLPLVILEAMQFSLPVVSTEEGAISEIVDDGITGFIIPRKDSQALAEKLELLILNSELRTQMGVAGRKKYESAYTLEHFEKRFIDILDRIIQSA